MAAISQGPQGLHRLLDSKVTVLLIDGRHVVGHLKGYEQNFTLVLEQCKEMVYGGKGGVQEIDLGTYVVRGDAVAVVGELDEAAFAGVEWSKVRGETLGEMFKGGQT